MSLFKKSFYMLLAAGLVPVFLLFLNYLFNVEGRYQKAAERGYEALSMEMGQEIAGVVNRGMMNLQLLAENPVMRDAASSDEQILRELKTIRSYHPLYKDLSYVGLDGRVNVSVGNSFRGAWKTTPWFQNSAAGLSAASDAHSLPHAQDVLMILSTPVFTQDNAVQGVLVGQLDMERLKDITRRPRSVGFSRIFVMDGHGVVVECSEGSHEPGLAAAEALLARESLQNCITIPFTEDGRQYVAVSSPVPSFLMSGESRWVLSLVFTKEEFYGPYRLNRAIFLLTTLFSVLLVFAISFLYSLNLQKRLGNVEQAVLQLENEEAVRDIVDDKGDELSDLLEKVNRSRTIVAEARKERQNAMESLVAVNRSLAESNQRFQLAADGANDAIWDWNIPSGELYLSKRWNHILGVGESRVYSRMEDWFDTILPEDRDRVKEVLQDHLNGETPLFSVEYRVMNRNSGMRWLLSRGLAFRNEENVDVRMAGSHTDITISRQLQEKLHFNVYHDALTNLPNRLKLRDRIQESFLRKERDESFRFTLLYLDFDGFKHVNDTFGHRVGDLLLVAIAERLSHCVRPLDLVSRIGGDEFVILLDSIAEGENVQPVLDRIMKEVNKPFHIDGHTLFISVSIGISELGEGESSSPDEMIQRADIAMYQAKNEGKAQYVFYENSMGSHEKRRWFLENEMHKALGTHAMNVHYQPIVSSDAGGIYGMEALLRWEHADQGFISPAEFIPIAEESGFITQITQWLLFQVCHQAVLINQGNEYDPPVRIALNVSSRDFLTPEGLDAIVHSTLQETGCRPDWIAIEVTERILIKDFDIVSRQLKKISDMGVLVELDDFGTGYSSLSYLNKFPLKILKVDRSFVMTMTESDASRKLVRTIIHMAKDLGMQTIGEGVEEEEQRQLLCEMGCDYIQGFLIAKPLKVEEISVFLAEWFVKRSGSPSSNAYF